MYTIVETVMEWNRVVVYRSLDGQGRPVLLKVLRRSTLPVRSEDREERRLANEYQLAANLPETAVLRPLALESFEGRPALVLEDPGGVSLGRLVGRPLDIGRFLDLATGAAASLAKVHQQGIIHKDIKPEHLFVDNRGTGVKITGFGIATRLPREQPVAGSPALIEGTLAYMSPEQTGRMNRALDQRTDLYSLGVTFYQLLTGALPFAPRDPLEAVHCHIARVPLEPAQVVPDLPPVISRMVIKLLAKAPEDRYQSAAGLQADLDRCLGALRAGGRIDDFPLGEHDAADRLRVPHKLYGRDLELAALEQAFAEVLAHARPALLLVTGPSGIGKSALAHQLEKSVVRERGRFFSGKADQSRRSVPYSTIAAALTAFVTEVMGESDDRIAEWRGRLTEALGGDGLLLLDLVPRLELVIEKQPAIGELRPQDAEIRFQRAFQRLLGAISATEPLVLFIDDLQWADVGTLRLLSETLAQGQGGRLLVMGAYREKEVDAADAIGRMIFAARSAGLTIRELPLPPLDSESVSALVDGTLHAGVERVAPLARLIHEKTAGNPFFVRQFFERLHRDGLLAFDHERGSWRWDVDRIGTQSFTSNVVDFLVAEVNRLSAQARAMLELAACVGDQVEARMLATLSGGSEDRIRQDLLEAIESGLLLPQGGGYRFAHDRVRQAACRLLPEAERAAFHLRIGRFLRDRTPAAPLEGQIFDVVDQLNLARPLLTSERERRDLAALNAEAGRRAQASQAWASAVEYFKAGAAVLAPDAWQRDYELAFGIHLGWSECALAAGAMDEALAQAEAVKVRARTKLDRTTAYRQLQAVQFARGDHEGFRTSALECLALLGKELPTRPSHQDVVAARAALEQKLAGRSIESLLDLPPMASPEARAAMRLLPLTYQADENLMRMQVMRMVELGFEQGLADESVIWLGMYALVLAGVFEAYAEAHRFAKIALALAKQRNLRYELAAAELLNGYVEYWTESVDVWPERFRQAVESAREVGNSPLASVAALYVLVASVARGEALDECATRAEQMWPWCRARMAREGLRAYRQLVRCLQGKTRGLSSFDDDDFDERSFEANLGGEAKLLDCWYWVPKLRVCYLAGDYAGARAASLAASSVIAASAARFPERDFHLYSALTVIALLEGRAAGEAAAILEEQLETHEQKLRRWAQVNPGTFRAGHALVSAETARLRGKHEEAARLYDESLRAARAIPMSPEEALACELAARFYQSRGFELIADSYLREARAAYAHWGALGKVQQLEALHPSPSGQSRLFAAGATMTTSSETLDVLSVVKASQAISGEVVLERLLQTLMEVTLAQGGARRACLVLPREDGLWLEAEALVSGATTEVRLLGLPLPKAPAESAVLPISVLQYVWRTGESVLLDATTGQGRLAGDAYFSRVRPPSVLGLPIRGRGAVLGALYLENDMLAGAFTAARLTVLELLAGQAAISLENARLLEREQAGRAVAEAAERRATFLADAGALLSETLHFETVLERLARLTAQRLADWCVIDLVVEGEIRRVTGAHSRPEKEPLLAELQRRYPPGWDSPHPAVEVMRTGHSLLFATLSSGRHRLIGVDQEHQRLALELGAASGMVVPLVARGRVLGAISLGSARAGHFGPADLQPIEDLARRAGMAIDNAQLYAQTQEAVRLRDEFLSVASHELNTPMAALSLSLEGMLTLPPEMREDAQCLLKMAGMASRHSRRLGRLIGELLDVTHIERRSLFIERQWVELGALLRDVLVRYERELTRAGCEVVLECTEVVSGRWDPLRIEQVVTNLLSNAVKFGAGKPIEIRVERIERHAHLSITDQGIGVQPAQRTRIFERFARAVSPSHYGGLGLGLYVCRRILEAHGGTIRVESELGLGATFAVELPLDEVPERRGAENALPPDETEAAHRPLAGS